MKKHEVQNRDAKFKNTIVISFRITPHMSSWMRKENLSPRSIVIKACQEFGYKPQQD